MERELIETIEYHIENNMMLTVERKNLAEADNHRGFPIKLSDNFLLMTDIYDFHDEGYILLFTKDITDVYSKESDIFYEQICLSEGLNKNISDISLTELIDLKNIFKEIKKMRTYIIIHCENDIDDCNFYMGVIKTINDDSVDFLSIGTDGEWEKKIDNILYDRITMIAIGTSYSNMFYKYRKEEDK